MSKNTNGNSSDRIPTVSYVGADTLVELVYDAMTQKTALAISRFGGLWNLEEEVRIGTGKVLIPYSPQNSLIASGCVLLPSQPVEYGLKDELIRGIRAFINRYVDLSPSFELIAAYYVLLTWVHDAFGELPYLRFLGDYGTGKTRALMTIGSLCYKPFFASGASTVSPIFHTLDAFGGTLVLDEADLPYSDAKADLVKILNNGTVKGMPVLRTIVNRHKEFNPYAFKVFGPKLIATRELFQDRALESRLLTEQTGTRSLRSDIPIHLPPSFKEEALQLRNRLLHFRFAEFYNVKTNPDVLLQKVQPRLNQMALSLLSLVDDPLHRAEIQSFFMTKNGDQQEERRETIEGRLILATLETFAEKNATRVGLHAIAQRYNAQTDQVNLGSVSNKWLGHALRTRLGLRTVKSGGVYVVPQSEFSKLQALADRYAISTDTPGKEAVASVLIHSQE